MCFVSENRSTRVLVPVPWMNAPFLEIVMRFRSGGRSMSSRQSNAGPETDVANQKWRSVIFKTRPEWISRAQNISCLTQWRQVPLGQELLATEVHRRDAP